MKLAHEQGAGHQIRGYGPGYVQVDDQRITTSLIVSARHLVHPWRPATLAELSRADIESLLPRDPQIVLIGTGSTHRFPDPSLLVPLMERGIGYELMTTEAACRTYNLLNAEDRQVLAVLFVEG